MPQLAILTVDPCPALPAEKAQQLSRQLNDAEIETRSVTIPCQTSSCTEPLPGIGNGILTAEFDLVIFNTGAGTNAFLDSMKKTIPAQRLLDCLNDMTTVASPAANEALQQAQIQPTCLFQSSHPDILPDWRDLLVCLDRNLSIANQNACVEYAPFWPGLKGGLESRGARVTEFAPFEQPASSGADLDDKQSEDQLQDALRAVIHDPDVDAILLGSPFVVWHLIQACRNAEPAQAQRWQFLLDQRLLIAVGDDTEEMLQSFGLVADWKLDTCDLGDDIDSESIVAGIRSQRTQKQTIRLTLSGPSSNATDTRAPWYDSPFMKACRGEPTDVTPIWMMRQAGRYMAEYRAVREKVSFLDLCANPQLCSEVMCTAVNRLGVDAAIIFSDLLPILVPMGCDLEFVKGDGPVIHNPIRESSDIDRIQPLANNDELDFVIETVRQTRCDLPADMPLIGFAGAPFTLASYMIEGGASRNYANTKKLMFGDSGAWSALMERLVTSISIYLRGQIEAGAQCVQLFDSWAGCLSFDDYRVYVLPYVDRIIRSLPPEVPVINFATGNPSLLPLLARTRASVIGIDWRIRLDDAWQQIGFDRAVQGNLDPTILLSSPQEIRKHAKRVLDQAAGRPGHIFNLGHGILPMTPVDHAIALVDAVHELSQQ